MKCVIIVDQTLPLGLIANTCAVLAVSIGQKIEGIVGEDVVDRDGTVHSGITQVSIPVLKGDPALIGSLRDRLVTMQAPDLFFVDFCDVAQKSRHYAQYKTRLGQTPAGQLRYLGIAICGDDRQVNSLTGNIGLLQ